MICAQRSLKRVSPVMTFHSQVPAPVPSSVAASLPLGDQFRLHRLLGGEVGEAGHDAALTRGVSGQ